MTSRSPFLAPLAPTANRVSTAGQACSWLRPLASTFLLATALGCSGSGLGTGAPWVELGGERIEVEIADDDAERARGLMYRDALPRGEGMLFIFDRSEPQAFWMKNTRIPLDILYFGSDLKLVSASLHTPPCRSSRCPSYPSQGAARYVLELAAGEAERLGVEPGTSLLIDPRVGVRAP